MEREARGVIRYFAFLQHWYIFLRHVLKFKNQFKSYLSNRFQKYWTFSRVYFFLFICFIEVSLIYSVLVLGVQQSDLIIWVCVKEKKVKSLSRVQLFATPWMVACTRLLHPWDFLGKSTGVGCRFLLQGIFLTQGSNPGLPHCRQTLYHLSHQGSGGLLTSS